MAGNKKSVTDKVYDELLNMILRGELKPDEKIPSENELKDRFGVSRNTVRAVLNRLNVLGVLETRRGDGTFVRSIGTDVYLNNFVPSILTNSSDLIGLMEFRRGIETASARLAAVNATEEDIHDLSLYFDELRGKEVSKHEFATMTSSFHARVAIASKNDLFVHLMELIKLIITSKMEAFLYFKPNVADSSFYHRMVFESIKARKPDEAAYLMDRHMSLLLKRVEDYIDYIAENPVNEELLLKEKRNVTGIYDF